jgi:hypothetical protein
MKICWIPTLACLSSQLFAAAPPTLTQQEKAAGWKLLFDGTTMNGWVDPGDLHPRGDAWTVSDGCLKAKSHAGITEDLFTRETYRDFELQFDWKISPAGNSGLKYRIQDHFFINNAAPGRFELKVEDSVKHRLPRMTKGQDYVVGFEYQMTDDAVNGDAKGNEKHTAGALYDMVAPASHATLPVGEFNHSRIVLKGNHVEHWLNGKKVVDSSLDSSSALAGIRQRWRDTPEVLTMLATQPRKECPISLQNHGDEAWFRNIKIRKL